MRNEVKSGESAVSVDRLVRLWLDDIRDPDQNGHIGWTWAKTAQEAIDMLKTGRVVEASLDHDLAIQ